VSRWPPYSMRTRKAPARRTDISTFPAVCVEKAERKSDRSDECCVVIGEPARGAPDTRLERRDSPARPHQPCPGPALLTTLLGLFDRPTFHHDPTSPGNPTPAGVRPGHGSVREHGAGRVQPVPCRFRRPGRDPVESERFQRAADLERRWCGPHRGGSGASGGRGPAQRIHARCPARRGRCTCPGPTPWSGPSADLLRHGSPGTLLDLM
jgi:hypothetical protein